MGDARERAGAGARPYAARRFGPRATAVFIKALEDGATVNEASARAGIDRSTAYHRRDRNEPFRLAWKEAVEKSCRLRPYDRNGAPGGSLKRDEPRPHL